MSSAASDVWKGKRRYARVYPLSTQPVELQIMGPGYLEVLHCADISVGGAGVRVPHGFEGYELQQEVELIVKLPGAPAFKAIGLVRHRRTQLGQGFFGVQFVHLEPDDRKRLHAYVEKMVRLRRS